MGVKLSEITGQEATVTFSVGEDGTGDQVTVVYRPQAYTPALEESVRGIVEGGELSQGASLVAMLVGLAIRWDVLDDDGVPIPFTPEALSVVPVPFLSRTLREIGRHNRPPEVKD